MGQAGDLSIMEKRNITPVSAAKKKTDTKKTAGILARGELKAAAGAKRASAQKQKDCDAKKAKKARWRQVGRNFLVQAGKKKLAATNIRDETTEALSNILDENTEEDDGSKTLDKASDESDDDDSETVLLNNSDGGPEDEDESQARREPAEDSEQEDIDDSDLPINVAQRSFRAPPHFRAPIYCMGGPEHGWIRLRGGDWFPDTGITMPAWVLGHTDEIPNWWDNPPPLPEAPPCPDDEWTLLVIYANFNKIWMRERHCTVTGKKGTHTKGIRPRFEVLRLYAGCLLYYSHMANLGLKSRARFQDIESFADDTDPGHAAMSRKDRSILFLRKLFYMSPYLSQGESPRSFIETMRFGQGLVNMRQTVKKSGWWREGAVFDGNLVLGVREDLKPFFELLRFDTE
jgi:hypothetical protein